MKTFSILCALFLAACSFDPSGVAYDVPDSGSVTDAGAGQDGAADIDAVLQPDGASSADAAPSGPAPVIECGLATVDGQTKQTLTFSGDIGSGFLTDPVPSPGATPVVIEYGSDYEDLVVLSLCPDRWAVPYQAGCPKPSAAWGPSPVLYLEPEVDDLNVALRYSDGTVRWGDLKTSDGDPPGFGVGGFGSGYNCHVILVNGGTGGYIHIDP